jgi:hypothetical protein
MPERLCVLDMGHLLDITDTYWTVIRRNCYHLLGDWVHSFIFSDVMNEKNKLWHLQR